MTPVTITYRQEGFTLIEVAVAFAVFALCVGALLEVFGASARRAAQSRERQVALMKAQSVLSEVRVTRPPWTPMRSSSSADGLTWSTEVEPLDVDGIDAQSPWRAYHVTVRVRADTKHERELMLESIELVRATP